ncbi:MAG: hypothetical protein J0I07_14510 [Myxococcales bacterium]|nr:hypothetical protein [Myxococcales bacterium]
MRRIATALAIVTASAVGCATTERPVAFEQPTSGPEPGFTVPDGGQSIEASVDSNELNLCPSNECPFPLLTCASSTYLCDVNPLSNDQNCGGCGIDCTVRGIGSLLNAGFGCVNGACTMFCSTVGRPYADCDGVLENGCETPLFTGTNCGACNDACPPSQVCRAGTCADKCLHPTVDTECGCKDLQNDDANCGACGIACAREPVGFPAPPPNAIYGCVGGQCNRLKCDTREHSWTDCNGDLQKPNSDGCEVDLSKPLDGHCGTCGVQCASGEKCGVDARASGPPSLECLCRPGETRCAETGIRMTCANLDIDPANCGACGRRCPGGSHGIAVCRAGTCGVVCDPGWLDCNGFEGDGCETNAHQDPANCGACGVKCDGGESQACVAGKCVVEECQESDPQ